MHVLVIVSFCHHLLLYNLTGPGSYGPDVRVVPIDLLDDPDPLKKVDALPDSEEKLKKKGDILAQGKFCV